MNPYHWHMAHSVRAPQNRAWASAPVIISMKYNRLDGTQHLGNAAAERRDRRKDAALQENGYTGLRLLTQDVGKHLDDLLDAILRTISRLKRDRVTENLPP